VIGTVAPTRPSFIIASSSVGAVAGLCVDLCVRWYFGEATWVTDYSRRGARLGSHRSNLQCHRPKSWCGFHI
jgi:hypothetical protein